MLLFSVFRESSSCDSVKLMNCFRTQMIMGSTSSRSYHVSMLSTLKGRKTDLKLYVAPKGLGLLSMWGFLQALCHLVLISYRKKLLDLKTPLTFRLLLLFPNWVTYHLVVGLSVCEAALSGKSETTTN